MTGQQAPTRGVLRIVRGVALAVMSAALAVAAHAVSGGMVPDLGLTALLTVGVAAVGIAMADRRRSQGTILLVLGAAQLATHVLLSVASQDMSRDVVNPLVMTGAHAAAVVLAAALLARADAVVLGLAGVVAALLPRVLVTPPPPVGPPVSWCWAVPVDRAMAVLLCRASPRRGPPVPA